MECLEWDFLAGISLYAREMKLAQHALFSLANSSQLKLLIRNIIFFYLPTWPESYWISDLWCKRNKCYKHPLLVAWKHFLPQATRWMSIYKRAQNRIITAPPQTFSHTFCACSLAHTLLLSSFFRHHVNKHALLQLWGCSCFIACYRQYIHRCTFPHTTQRQDLPHSASVACNAPPLFAHLQNIKATLFSAKHALC